MNFLKKKLKPLTSGLTSSSQAHGNKQNKDLEDDLYDEYVVEAPPHPSELLALGVEPGEIDVNDPDKLRELYRKAKEEGKDKKVNSVLLAKQRQKEEIEEKKKTREEWKYFDSITARVEQVVKESQKNLNQWKESSAIDKLNEPDYELRLTPEQVIKFRTGIPEKRTSDINNNNNNNPTDSGANLPQSSKQELDAFGCPKVATKKKDSVASQSGDSKTQFVVNELLEDFGLDLRSAEEKRKAEERELKLLLKKQQEEAEAAKKAAQVIEEQTKKLDINPKVAARPRPRPKSEQIPAAADQEPDPFDTSFVEPVLADLPATTTTNLTTIESIQSGQEKPKEQEKLISTPSPAYDDPFDTSYVNF